jgi:tripartite-type tricarboxylate transporter receptor subunit TctC
MMLHRGVSLLIAGLLALPLAAMAQEAYPNRTVRWVVPFPAGGPTDTLSRILVG